jgi:hypothetical protein
MSWEEFLQFAKSVKEKGIDSAKTVIRGIVYENPYARIPLSRELFKGPFDERFGPDGDHIVRLYAREEVLKIETEEASVRE